MQITNLLIFATAFFCTSFSEKSRAEDATATLNHSALKPVPKLEDDIYDWYARHEAILAQKNTINPEIILIGDSITHFWGGEPTVPGQAPRGPVAWKEAFGHRKVLNLGFGWDRTQNVLWRLENGEIDGLKPKFVVLNIGTNNFSGTKNAPTNTPAEVAQGIRQILKTVHQKAPKAKIVLMSVFPRGFKSDDGFRAKIQELNAILAKEYTKHPVVNFLNIYPNFLEADGSLSSTIMNDGVHPVEAGYAIWAKALKPLLK